MFDLGDAGTVRREAGLDAGRVRAFTTQITTATAAAVAAVGDEASLVEMLTALEELKCAAEGLQADVSVAVDTTMRTRAADHQIPAARQGRGIGHVIALARRESPYRGQQHLGLALVLARELPHTRAALRAGLITEWRATLIARETACLSREDRATVDTLIAADPHRLSRMGDRQTAASVRREAYRLDPEAWVTRRRTAESERRVTLRPAPDVMTLLSATLPVAQGVAVLTTLRQHADSLRAAGDPRTRSQAMADTLINRLLGTETPTHLPVTTHVIVDDTVLFGTAEHPAHLDGYGPIPAELARELVKTAANTRDRTGKPRTSKKSPQPKKSGRCLAELRRLYVTPDTGALVAADATTRYFPAALAQLIDLRDQTCRTPWCDAPIRHHDHITPAEAGGPTSLANAQGLCEACNYAKQTPRWRSRPAPATDTPCRSPHQPATPTTPKPHHHPTTDSTSDGHSTSPSEGAAVRRRRTPPPSRPARRGSRPRRRRPRAR